MENFYVFFSYFSPSLGLQSNFTYSRGYSTQGCVKAYQEESKVTAPGDSICHREVSVLFFPAPLG